MLYFYSSTFIYTLFHLYIILLNKYIFNGNGIRIKPELRTLHECNMYEPKSETESEVEEDSSF